MSDIHVVRAHGMDIEAARQVAEQAARDLAERFDMQWHWEENSLFFQRPGVSGVMRVTGTDLAITVQLGFLLKAFRRDIEGNLLAKLDQRLSGAA
jgi:putative polyhydroxyalkanoate system protein